MDKNNIVLIGMPGVGKSTIGVILAKVLGYKFIDTDLIIQEKEQKLLSQIIAESGVDGFIKIEDRINSELKADKSVIATGGSVIYGENAMKNLKSIGKVIYLKQDFDSIQKRVQNIKGRGVALKDNQTFEELYNERAILYEKYADITIEEGSMDIEETLKALLEKL
ncbi:MAG: shikimate kinase [Clostridia bacterium]|nr:shikimate kinase [Clostridia bacterium]